VEKLMSDGELETRLKQFAERAMVRGATSGFAPPLNPPDGRPSCTNCEGAGWAPNENGRYVRCECVVPPEAHADGCPYEFRAVTVEAYDARDGQKPALDKATWALNAERDVYIYGGVGAGKSRLACALANSHYRARKTAMVARVPMLLHQLQPGRDNAEIEAQLLRSSLLVMDDLGAERDQATDYTRRTLLMIYEGRCDANLRTIFTSNKSLQELAEMQDDDRLSSRIAGRCDVVRMTTGDQRLIRRVKR
jgi:hypothetical protein